MRNVNDTYLRLLRFKLQNLIFYNTKDFYLATALQHMDTESLAKAAFLSYDDCSSIADVLELWDLKNINVGNKAGHYHCGISYISYGEGYRFEVREDDISMIVKGVVMSSCNIFCDGEMNKLIELCRDDVPGSFEYMNTLFKFLVCSHQISRTNFTNDTKGFTEFFITSMSHMYDCLYTREIKEVYKQGKPVINPDRMIERGDLIIGFSDEMVGINYKGKPSVVPVKYYPELESELGEGAYQVLMGMLMYRLMGADVPNRDMRYD